MTFVSGKERAFRALLEQPEPATECKKLLIGVSPAGQMHALLGLLMLDKEAFQAAVVRYKGAGKIVLTASGCIVMHRLASQLTKQIEEGRYQ